MSDIPTAWIRWPPRIEEAFRLQHEDDMAKNIERTNEILDGRTPAELGMIMDTAGNLGWA